MGLEINFYIGIVLGLAIAVFMIYTKITSDGSGPTKKKTPRGKEKEDEYDDSELRAIQKEEKERGN